MLITLDWDFCLVIIHLLLRWSCPNNGKLDRGFLLMMVIELLVIHYHDIFIFTFDWISIIWCCILLYWVAWSTLKEGLLFLIDEVSFENEFIIEGTLLVMSRIDITIHNSSSSNLRNFTTQPNIIWNASLIRISKGSSS